MNFTAFFSYVILTAITPGPNNIMSMSNASRYGFRRSLPFNFGVFAGFIVVMSVSALFSSLLYNVMPSVKPFMLCVGAAYILWMVWHILRSSGVEAEDNPDQPTFRRGLLVQLTNVKIMVFCLTALASYVLPYTDSFWWLLGVGLFLPFTGPMANLVWLFAGASLQKLFSRHRRAVDIVLSLSLVACAVNLVWPH